MDISWFRERVKDVPKYRNSDRWRIKVDQMPSNQVIAIYHKFLESGMYRTEKKAKEPKVVYTQLSLFDIYPDVMKGVK